MRSDEANGPARARLSWSGGRVRGPMWTLLFIWVWVCGLGAVGRTATLVQTNSTWSYRRGTNEASAPVGGWRVRDYAGSGWAFGRTPFYYGEPLTGGTPITGMQNVHSTLFLRQEFAAAALATNEWLVLEAECDDGFIAWINGREVARFNAPAGEPLFNSLAPAAATEPVTGVLYYPPDPREYLAEGVNVLAVQVFNNTLASSDLVFNASLKTLFREMNPPQVIGVRPAAGNLENLDEITVTFSEPVRGVDAEDLWVNGIPADTVTGGGAVYTFGVSGVRPGLVTVTFFANHGIEDLALPPNSFDEAMPAHSWGYQLADLVPPELSGLNPGAGATVRSLTQVEVRFDEPVEGVEAADLLRDGLPASGVRLVSPSSFVFTFPAAGPGQVAFAWSPGHGIRDTSGNTFRGGTWTCRVDPSQTVADLVINEFLAGNASATGLKDEDGEVEDWIELHNRGSFAVNLAGWSLTDTPDAPDRWVFPAITVGPNQYVVVFASGKDRTQVVAGRRLHTNFKLSVVGEYLGLYAPESPRRVVSELVPGYPEQRIDHSYGRLAGGDWGYFSAATPGAANGSTVLRGRVEPVHFSVTRGFFNEPIRLSLVSPTPGATVRYTLDGSEPTEARGFDYTTPIQVNTTAVVRAAGFLEGRLPSRVDTHTYLVGLTAARRSLPVLSLVTATNHLRGPKGIMEINPRNTTKAGIAWERPTSAELIEPADNGGFQIDCGLRVQGGAYIRGQYNPNGGLPFSKYSFRLYFRGDYGSSKLRYPLFAGSRVQEFDRIVLRAGMNDHSDPFIVDEMMRRLAIDTGQVTARGTLVNLFINGQYKGYYNPTEGYEEDFFQSWQGGGDQWDLIAQFGEVVAGDATAWNALRTQLTRDQTIVSNYTRTAASMDLTNFVDYLLVNIYGGTGDWPHNNWRAARERVAGAPFRFYMWDAEWSLGNQGRSVSINSITGELGGDSDIGRYYRALQRSPEFRLLFADRVQKHFFNDGALTELRLTNQFNVLREQMRGVLPNMNQGIVRTWIPQRRRHMFTQMNTARLVASNAPSFNQLGGRVPAGFELRLSASNGAAIYYTTNGADPRVPFTSVVAPVAFRFDDNRPLRLSAGIEVKARSLAGTNWSALSEARFQVDRLGVPLVFSEIMYHPPGGDAHEFIEILNTGDLAIDLGGMLLDGVSFAFPAGTSLAPGGRAVVASSFNVKAFAERYPGVTVVGYFDGSLSNGGERVALIGSDGRVITAVTYADDLPWPARADGLGSSIEVRDAAGDPNDPANWFAGVRAGGSPGGRSELPAVGVVRLSELLAENVAAVTGPGGDAGSRPDYVELFNAGATRVDLAGWSLSDDADPRRYVFPAGAAIEAGAYLVVWCDGATAGSGLHAPFSLNRSGETVTLYDGQTNVVDGVSYGPQAADYALGRIGGNWGLNKPTPGVANQAAGLGQETDLTINEWMADPLTGDSDWIELHNRHSLFPVGLQGLWLGTSNALFQLRAPGFIPALGHVRLFADEGSGPDQIGLRLPATGGAIVLYGAEGAEIERVVYGLQREGVSTGRMPDGAQRIESFADGGTPGAPNFLPVYRGPLLNEVMARNAGGVVDPRGGTPDWIEFSNTNAVAWDLAGMTIRVRGGGTDTWTFPAKSSVPARGYLVVWCDPDRAASTGADAVLNTGFGLAGEGAEVELLDLAGVMVDRVTFGAQIENLSVGRAAGVWRLLARPSAGLLNAPAAETAPYSAVKFNEWMANPSEGDGWFELYNTAATPADLGGCYLTDDPSIGGRTRHLLPPLTLVAPRGWVSFLADGRPERGAGHVSFQLDPAGETLRFYTPSLVLADEAWVLPQLADVSEGRFRDGVGPLTRFGVSASPGAANWLPHPVLRVNELLTHTDPPFEDAIELHNPSDQPVAIGGWGLSDNRSRLLRRTIPLGTVVPARGYAVLYENLFNPSANDPSAFTLNSAHGGEVWIAEMGADGQPTGYRLFQPFGATRNGVALGSVRTSVGADVAVLSRRTFGVDTPASVAEFRGGRGAVNAPALIPRLVISEILYHSVAAPESAAAEEDFEYIELLNPGAVAVPLFDPAHPENRIKVGGGIEFEFPRGLSLQPGAVALLVSFDAATNAAALNAFRARFNVPAGVLILGPFKGRLANSGDEVALFEPDNPQGPEHPDAGFVPYALMERIVYRDTTPWPAGADGTGLSLQRLAPGRFGNDPLNWIAAVPSAGRPNPAAVSPDADADGQPDAWETVYGLDPNNSLDAVLDADTDSQDNLAEYRSGTNPRDAADVLALEWEFDATAGAALVFDAQPGIEYVLVATDSLGAGAWSQVGTVSAAGEPRRVRLAVPVGSGSSRYFRLSVAGAPRR